MDKQKIKIIIAWILLIILMTLFFYVNYVKFFLTEFNSAEIEEIPIENSSSEAIELALTNIVDNFNSNPLIEQYKNEGITMSAVLNNYSIYISYTKDTTTTYEFNYSNLILSINITNEEENKNKFNKVYEILIKAVQQRIGNEVDITNIIDSHLNDGKNYEGLTSENNEDTITYNMNITNELKIEEGSE